MPNIITIKSPYSVKDTIDRISQFLQQHGVTIYARIDQQAEAAKSNIVLRPLEFLLFGNPQKGGVLMAANPQSALDLPLKIIAWQNETGDSFVTCNDAVYITSRYDLSQELAALIDIAPLIKKALDI